MRPRRRISTLRDHEARDYEAFWRDATRSSRHGAIRSRWRRRRLRGLGTTWCCWLRVGEHGPRVGILGRHSGALGASTAGLSTRAPCSEAVGMSAWALDPSRRGLRPAASWRRAADVTPLASRIPAGNAASAQRRRGASPDSRVVVDPASSVRSSSSRVGLPASTSRASGARPRRRAGVGRRRSAIAERAYARLRPLTRRIAPASSGWTVAHAARSFSRQSGSSARSRRTRSPTGGCVTNEAASPSSANGFVV